MPPARHELAVTLGELAELRAANAFAASKLASCDFGFKSKNFDRPTTFHVVGCVVTP